jgi:hypothetical protein
MYDRGLMIFILFLKKYTAKILKKYNRMQIHRDEFKED